MEISAQKFAGVTGAEGLRPADAIQGAREAGWSRAGLSGRLAALSGEEASAVLTAAMGLVRDAQREGETTAWVTSTQSLFFPPDAREGGIDLGALALIRVPGFAEVPRAADKLARSGAFGLIVLDLQVPRYPSRAGFKRAGPNPHDISVPMPLESRLLGLAQKHDTAILFLLGRSKEAASLGALISLRGRACRTRVGQNRFEVEVRVVKDKYRAPSWAHGINCHGPAGLC